MDSTTVEDRGYVTRNLNICLIVFSTIIISLRCYVRQFMLKSFGWDDCLAVTAWVILIVQSALEIVEVGNGSGRHMQDISEADLARFFSTLTTMELLYFIATGLVRLSIVVFIPRLSKEKKVLRITQALFGITTAMSLICFFVLLFECKHIPDVWDRLNPNRQCLAPSSESYLFWTHASIGIAIDIALLVIPIWLIYSRMMLSIAAIKVILVFGVGLFVLVTGIVRLVIIVSVEFGVDTTWQLQKLSTWADLEGHIGLWVACFPSLPPIIRLAAQNVGLRAKSQPKGSSAGEVNAWENNARTYVQSGSEVHLGIKENSVFDDDSSSKMAAVEERDVGMEMDRIQWNKRH